MSSVEKKRKKKSKKKTQSKAKTKVQASEEKADVLEKVMDSIEMAGASLDFFDGEADETENVEAAQEEVVEVEANGEVSLSEQSEESIDPSGEPLDDVVETQDGVAEPLGDIVDDEAENLSLIEEENTSDFVDQTQAYSILESVLFSSDRPLGLGTFKQIFKGTNYKTKEIKKALEELKSVYAEASRGVSLEEINGGWQLRTKVDNMDFMRKLAKARPFKLSGPALEVLAIIAYKQPLIKSEVDQIRGVESGHLVRALMEKHLVSFQGKSEFPGKPMLYGTTRKFLEIFGLRNLKELPSLDEIDQLLPDGIGMEEEDEKLSDVTANMSENYEGNYSEGEEELLKITDTLGSIDTSSEFFEEEKVRQREKRDRERAQDIREAMDVGEEVEDKDKKWLAKYDQKMMAAAEALEASTEETLSTADQELMNQELGSVDAETGESLPVESADGENVLEFQPQELVAEEASLTDELSALTDESMVEPEAATEEVILEASREVEVSSEPEDIDMALADDDSNDEMDPFDESDFE